LKDPFSQPPNRAQSSSILHLISNEIYPWHRASDQVHAWPAWRKRLKHSFLLTMSSEQISYLSDVLATQAPLADPHLLGWQIRKNGANIGSVLPLFQKGRRSMDVDRRAVTAGLAGFTFSTALSGLARAQQLEKPSVRLGVANKAHLYYLPLTLAERRGHFKDYGLNVAITDFEGGAQSLDALLAGTVDVVTGAYEHTLRMQAQGQDIRALIELGRFPGIGFLGDREIYVKALRANLLVYSKTGLVTRQGMNSALNMLATFDPVLKGAKIDVQKTFDDRFVKRATVLMEDPNNADLERDDRRPEIDLKTIRC
jgi:hypothetical protein